MGGRHLRFLPGRPPRPIDPIPIQLQRRARVQMQRRDGLRVVLRGRMLLMARELAR